VSSSRFIVTIMLERNSYVNSNFSQHRASELQHGAMLDREKLA
jgi:hypothetical protein